jgi:pyruvate/2-oxoglutarate dehydrogenase complex dihydrolipoamide acyltransferase (E2) component
MNKATVLSFPDVRIASRDICAIGKRRHHVTAFIEVDVTEARKVLHEHKLSFTAWMLRELSAAIKEKRQIASFLYGKRRLMLFEDVTFSVLVEKEVEGHKVPVPLLITNPHEKSLTELGIQLEEAKQIKTGKEVVVLKRKAGSLERLYSILPAFIRRWFWHYLLSHPDTAFRRMGNVAYSSVGMLGTVKGWFIPITVHPLCFGAGSIVKKPLVIHERIEIREVLHLTVLMDHDVIDGGEMARFISRLTERLEGPVSL